MLRKLVEPESIAIFLSHNLPRQFAFHMMFFMKRGVGHIDREYGYPCLIIRLPGAGR